MDASPRLDVTAAPLVLHLSADYPNPHRDPTTFAVKRLLERADGFRHVVISIKRTSNPLAEHFIDCGDDGCARLFAYRYFAPPLGFGLKWSMERLARRIDKALSEEGLSPDLVHAHKMCFEGVIARALQLKRGTPFIISVRGEAESKIFRYKPHYRRLLTDIAHRAERIYYVSAWFRDKVKALGGLDEAKQRDLPNLVAIARKTPSAPPSKARFVSVMNMNIYEKKGLPDVLKALASLRAKGVDVQLDVIGRGAPDARKKIHALIDRLGLLENVSLLPEMDNEEVVSRMQTYNALVLPSYNETFGMVFLEALYAGVPILYGLKTGIDGYLDGLDVGVGVRPGDVGAIADAFLELMDRGPEFRARIADSLDSIDQRFNGDAVVRLYKEDLRALTVGVSQVEARDANENADMSPGLVAGGSL